MARYVTFYYRNGEQATIREVLAAQRNYVVAKRTGRMGNLPCSVQPEVADSIERMTPTEFARWSGLFTYRTNK
jgi:hypothetical protein